MVTDDKGASAFGWIRDRRQGDRRRTNGAPPAGIAERRQGDRRRQSAAVVGGMVLVAGLAAPADGQSWRAAVRNPFSGVRLFVDPESHARNQADIWRQSRPGDAAQMDKIAAQPTAFWFGDWNGDILSSVDGRVTEIMDARAYPVLVAYNIPNRDCGGHSGGGAPNAAAYRDWIRRFALGPRNRPAAVILEPDALGHLGQCGTQAEQQERLDLLFDAVHVLRASGASVYIDAGHSGWMSADVAAWRLRAAGVQHAAGFSLNVSNFRSTQDEVAFGRAVSQRIGGKHFVVDTSRNGLGPNGTWCNPEGRALGNRPTAATGDAAADAFLWIKRPGQSDGTCNGGPPAGTWWPDYALGLAQRASY